MPRRKPPKESPRETPSAPPPPSRRRTLRLLLAAFLLLAATAGERTLGTITDEQQMLSTAVAVAETGQLGIARGQTFSIQREDGDALSPYGMGLPLLEAPLALLASPWECTFGPRTSQSLFALLAIALITAAAAGAAALAWLGGATARGEAVAIFGTAVASPLWAYGATALSEPLQAAALCGATALAALSARASGRRAAWLAAAAGFLAGWAVLTKAVNLALLPFVAAPLVLDATPARTKAHRLRGAFAWAAGAALPLGVWLAFEIVRYGRPLSSYQGQGFTHPPLDGLWRLLFGLNKGLIVYFPLALLGVAGAIAFLRAPERRGTGIAVGGVFATLLALSSAWWAWDGTGGWGPRLLVPAIPLLAGAAGAAVRAGRPWLLAVALLVAGAGVNLLGVLQPEPATQLYIDAAGPVKVAEEDAAMYPLPLRDQPGELRLLARRSVVSNRDAAYAPVRLHAFLLGVRLTADDRAEAQRRVEQAPWLASDPHARPVLRYSAGTYEEVLVNHLVSKVRWPHLFSVIAAGEEERRSGFLGAWNAALADQVQRALDVGARDQGVALATKLWHAAPSGYSASLLAETLRVAGRHDELDRFVGGLPEAVGRSPLVSLVQALSARDRGDERSAALHLGRASRAIRTPSVGRALAAPPSEWPARFRDFLR